VMRRMLVAGIALLGAVAAALALNHYRTEFMTDRSDRQQPVAAARAPDDTSDAFEFSFFDQPRALPDIRFADGEGHALSLSDLRGRPIVLNLWATWCVPCRQEMPALDRLQAAVDKSLLVLPLSVDRQGVAIVKQFYQELGLKALGIYVDQSGKASSELHAVGLPTTLLIDRDGREIGRKVGPAKWDSAEMIALIRQHLGIGTNEHRAGP
jgi:thiol-disulfide isomerase/thioredoxin